MKRKDIEQLKNKSATELKERTAALRENLWNLKKDLVAGKTKKAHQNKKSILQVFTGKT